MARAKPSVEFDVVTNPAALGYRLYDRGDHIAAEPLLREALLLSRQWHGSDRAALRCFQSDQAE